MTEHNCRYMTDPLLRQRCNAHATETHNDSYYRAPHPVCKEHKRLLVLANVDADDDAWQWAG